jgi:hypothetical protein
MIHLQGLHQYHQIPETHDSAMGFIICSGDNAEGD